MGGGGGKGGGVGGEGGDRRARGGEKSKYFTGPNQDTSYKTINNKTKTSSFLNMLTEYII